MITMKKTKISGILAVILFLICLVGVAQAVTEVLAPDEERIIIFEDRNHAYSVQQTSDGGYIIAGDCLSQAWIGKTDSNGNLQWDKRFIQKGISRAKSIRQTFDGGYIIAGYMGMATVTKYNDVWLMKTDSNGDIQWNVTFGELELLEEVYSIQQTSDGGYILVGTRGLADSYLDAWLIKTDSNGNMQWDKTFEGSDMADKAYAVQQTSDGGYILAGGPGPYIIDHGNVPCDAWLAKTDSNGNLQWHKSYGGAEWDHAYSVQQTSDGGYIFAGFTGSYGAGTFDAWLVKTNSHGDIQWSKTYGGTGWNNAESVKQTTDGGYIFGGRISSYNTSSIDVRIVKTDSNGDMQWDMAYEGTKGANAHSVQQTSDGGYIMVGEYNIYPTRSYAFLIKLNYTEKGTNTHNRQKSDNIFIPLMVEEKIPANTKTANEWNSEGIRLANKRDYGSIEKALEAFDNALEIDPQYAEACYNKGDTLDFLKRYEEAIECFNKAVEINPQYLEAWDRKGDTLDFLRRYEEAIECYTKVLEIDPQYVEAWKRKGFALLNLGRNKEAIECCDKALEIDPQFSLAWNTKGLALNQLGRYEEAIECYNKALEIDPQKDVIWSNKGDTLVDLERYEKAIECYNKALEIDPQYFSAWYGKEIALNKSGWMEEEKSTSSHEEGIPAFETVFAIAGLLVVAYLLRRRK
jgi:tetratricopeptide (TPR) repeat protein